MPPPSRLATLVAALAATAPNANAQDGDIAAGHSLARTACNACHVVDAEQHRPPWRIFIGPAFGNIANTRGKTATTLRDVLAKSHAKKLDSILTLEQMTDVIAYIFSRSDLDPESKRATEEGCSSGWRVGCRALISAHA